MHVCFIYAKGRTLSKQSERTSFGSEREAQFPMSPYIAGRPQKAQRRAYDYRLTPNCDLVLLHKTEESRTIETLSKADHVLGHKHDVAAATVGGYCAGASQTWYRRKDFTTFPLNSVSLFAF